MSLRERSLEQRAWLRAKLDTRGEIALLGLERERAITIDLTWGCQFARQTITELLVAHCRLQVLDALEPDDYD